MAERADVMLMQNWTHVGAVAAALNAIPRDGHGVDMMRVRDWALRQDRAGGLLGGALLGRSVLPSTGRTLP